MNYFLTLWVISFFVTLPSMLYVDAKMLRQITLGSAVAFVGIALIPVGNIAMAIFGWWVYRPDGGPIVLWKAKS